MAFAPTPKILVWGFAGAVILTSAGYLIGIAKSKIDDIKRGRFLDGGRLFASF